MPPTALAQTIAAKYNLDTTTVDRILHTDDGCGTGWQGEKGHCVRSKNAVKQTTEAVAAWGAGKILGGAIAQVASAHGLPPEFAQHVAESAVQAFTATALHAKDTRGATPIALAQKFVAEAAGAFSGKASAGFDDAILGGDDHLKALISNVSRAGAKSVIKTHAATLKNLIDRYQGNRRTDAADRLTGAERSALFDLTVAGMAIAQKLPRKDSRPMATMEAMTRAIIKYADLGYDVSGAIAQLHEDAEQCGRGWEGTKPGCTRKKKGGTTAKPSQSPPKAEADTKAKVVEAIEVKRQELKKKGKKATVDELKTAAIAAQKELASQPKVAKKLTRQEELEKAQRISTERSSKADPYNLGSRSQKALVNQLQKLKGAMLIYRKTFQKLRRSRKSMNI